MSIAEKKFVKNNKFIFACNGISFSFSKITNLSNSVEIETIEEGGYNNGPKFLIKPKTKVDTLILEQGMQRGLNENMLLRVGMPVLVGTIIVLNGILPVKIYGFEYGFITKWEVTDLDALNGSLLVKKLEISHSGLLEV